MSESLVRWLCDGWMFGEADPPRRAAHGAVSHATGVESEATAPVSAVTTTRGAMIGDVPAEELLAQIRAGSLSAFEQLYRALYPSLWRIARFRAPSIEAAQDIVHDTFLALWRRRTSIAIEKDLRVYLSASVRNRARDLRAHDDVIAAVDEAVEQRRIDVPAVSQVPMAPDEAAEASELEGMYRAALNALSEREREAAQLRWDEGMTFEQVAQVMGITKEGVRKIVQRAQEKVRALLESEGQLP